LPPERNLLVLLLPRPLEGFILRDQAEDLLRSPGVVAVEPARLPYGALGRLPDGISAGIAALQAKRLDLPGTPRAVAIFHPFQYPLARGILGQYPGCELWYGRWDRYERAYDAAGRTRARLELLHEQAAARSALTFVASEELARLEREAGREPVLVPLAADSFPAPDPTATVVAVSLGHHGWRVDWGLLAEVCKRMPELTLLVVGERHDAEVEADEGFRHCRDAPQIVWLGRQSDEAAARLIGCADVGVVPFERSDFNEAGLPYRILKYARQGRRTIAPPLAGVATWANAVDTAATAQDWIAALRAARGRRTAPDLALRDWALAQTAPAQNAPLWERMEQLQIG
jgi:hypothetical protein